MSRYVFASIVAVRKSIWCWPVINLSHFFFLFLLQDLRQHVSILGLQFIFITCKCFMQGKKEELRLESLAALEKSIRNVLTALGLMPSRYSEVCCKIWARRNPWGFVVPCLS